MRRDWLWKVGDRYGKLSVRNRSVSVHRIAWESATGERLGDRYALHTCDEPRCVNPRHLYDGTAKQNMEDMHRRRRWPSRRGELHPLCKLTEDELARLRSTGGTNAEVAARFGLSAGYVSELRRGLRR